MFLRWWCSYLARRHWRNEEGLFVWYKVEQPVKYTNWGLSEPNSNDLVETESCLAMWSSYRWEWADLNYDERAYFICEKGWVTLGALFVWAISKGSGETARTEDCLVKWSDYRWEWAGLNCDERA